MNMPLNTTADISDPIAQARYNLIQQQIRTWNVVDAKVLETLDQVHRENFVPAAYRSLAFVDMEIPCAATRKWPSRPASACSNPSSRPACCRK